MADPSIYAYPSPLAGYENAPALPDEKAADGKSFVNPQTNILSKSYDRFTEPLDNGIRGAFDIHVYYFQNNEAQLKFARELWQRIRYEFPELRIYTFWEKPVGPHPIAMFEVNLFTPAQFGAFIPWLVINRGPLSALVHPNTVDEKGEALDEYRDHTQRATWLGTPVLLDLGLFGRIKEIKQARKEKEEREKAEREKKEKE